MNLYTKIFSEVSFIILGVGGWKQNKCLSKGLGKEVRYKLITAMSSAIEKDFV